MLIFSGIMSCEKDFTDIGTSIVSNTKFSTTFIPVAISLENSAVEKVPSDNLTSEPGQYLLGVFASSDYEKIEASIVSQVAISTALTVAHADTITKYETGTTHIVTTIDTAFIKLPYQATLTDNISTGPTYTLDSIIGDSNKAFTFNAYQTSTYLSRLNPTEPSQVNKYYSNDVFDKVGSELNSQLNYQFIPNENDTVVIVSRRTSTNVLIKKDTFQYSSSEVPYPFARIPLKEDLIKTLFLDKYELSEFDSQDAFNDYFRGIILEATGTEGSLISFNFNNTSAALNPSIEVYYTNTVLETATNDTIKTFSENDSYSLSGIRVASYKMDNKIYPINNEVIVQGAAGNEAKIDLFGADLDGNNIADKIEELRAQNLLVNDASLSFYINQSADTTALPYRLYLYKDDENATQNSILSQIKDTYSETTFGGFLERVTDESDADYGKAEKYTFKITDYVSDLLSGESNYSPTLKLKVYNPTDAVVSDTIFTRFNWNPKAITLFNNSEINGDKKAELKISYTKKKN